MAGQSRAHISAAFLAASALVIASTALGQSNSPQEFEAARPPGEPNNIDTINQVTDRMVPTARRTDGQHHSRRGQDAAGDGESDGARRPIGVSWHEVFHQLQLRRLSRCERRRWHGAAAQRCRDVQIWHRSRCAVPGHFAWSAARHAGVGDGSAAERYLGPRELHRKHQQNTAAGVGRYGIGCGESPGHRADSRGIQTNSHPLGFHRAFQQGSKPTGDNPTAAQSEPTISPG